MLQLYLSYNAKFLVFFCILPALGIHMRCLYFGHIISRNNVYMQPYLCFHSPLRISAGHVDTHHITDFVPLSLRTGE